MTLLERYPNALINTFGPPKLALVSGAGATVTDENQKTYLDFLGGIAVNALGHAHPAIVEAVSGQLATLGHVSNFFTTGPQVDLAERLLELSAPLAHGRAGRVFFANSGTEANEAGFKLTRLTGRTKIVAAEGSFHGRTMGALALTSKAAYRQPFEPLPADVVFVPYADTEALRHAVDDDTAAVILEPIQGEAGVIVAPDDYLLAAREITAAHGALLWLDEVQTGIGRTGAWFAGETAGPEPDLITLAKGLGGGIPIGALVAFGEAATLLQPGNHGTTFGGNPVACAAALAVLDTIEAEGLLDHVQRVGKRLADGLDTDHVTQVRGRGLMIGLSLDAPIAAEVVAAALEAGFILNNPTPDRIRLVPPLILTEDQADTLIAAWPGIVQHAIDSTQGGPA